VEIDTHRGISQTSEIKLAERQVCGRFDLKGRKAQTLNTSLE